MQLQTQNGRVLIPLRITAARIHHSLYKFHIRLKKANYATANDFSAKTLKPINVK